METKRFVSSGRAKLRLWVRLEDKNKKFKEKKTIIINSPGQTNGGQVDTYLIVKFILAH
jgi:hypothetical protein